MTSFTLTGLLLLFVLLYFFEHAIYLIGVARGVRPPAGGAPFEDDDSVPHRSGRAESKGNVPLCTVLVCARDEERNIVHCLKSLEAIDYPKDRLEVLIVDDKSTDDTPKILEAWKERMPNLTVLRTGEEVMHLRGKVNALTQGMDVAKGEFVMITDADSRVKPNWVREYLKYYDEKTGMVASITLLNRKYFLDGIQSIDWAYLLGVAMASANIHVPLSVIGNNISVRRAAYEEIGGYRKIPFSITEDFALFQAIWQQGRANGAPTWKVKFPLHEDLLVMSEPCPDFKTWWRQKHRWVKGGQGLKAVGWLIFIIGLLAHLAMILALFALPLFPALLVIGIKWSADLLIIVPVLARSRMQMLLKYFPIYEVYLALFVFSMPLLIAQRNVKWKGRVYRQ